VVVGDLVAKLARKYGLRRDVVRAVIDSSETLRAVVIASRLLLPIQTSPAPTNDQVGRRDHRLIIWLSDLTTDTVMSGRVRRIDLRIDFVRSEAWCPALAGSGGSHPTPAGR